MRRMLCLLVALFMFTIGISSCLGEAKEEGSHNYILIIDNSRSTTGRHSLGGATDPNGLRFDAAKLVYENVVSSAASGSHGQIGVIVFCGPENCVSYGPMDINANPAMLNQEIGDHLNEAANENHRDNYTDIRTALDTARDMLGRFEGDTSIILLTDGVNDLTNTADPFNQPENIEANYQSITIVRDYQHVGADFYIIALTAKDSIRNAEAFMGFINQMAQAGGGNIQQDGSYDNVLMATQEDLSSKLLQMLIKAESSADADIQNFEQSTPLNRTFLVPFKGINEAKVNITFMPEDKSKLASIVLYSPDGNVYKPFDNNKAVSVNGITVSEDRSYIIISISQPASGTWNVEITGNKDAKIPINTVVRFNHKLRLQIETADRGFAGESQTIKAWFQYYDGTKYVDLKNSEIYEMSTATLDLISPSGKQSPLALSLHEGYFTKSIKLKSVGIWKGVLNVNNKYILLSKDDISIDIVPKPTPMPTPVPTAKPTTDSMASSLSDSSSKSEQSTPEQESPKAMSTTPPAPVQTREVESAKEDSEVANNSIQISGEGDSDFALEIDAVPDSNSIEVSWSGGEEGIVAELREKGSEAPVKTGIHPGDRIDLSVLDADSGYSLVIVGQDEKTGANIPMQAVDLQVVDPNEAMDVALTLVDAAVKITPAILNAKPIEEGQVTSLSSGESSSDQNNVSGIGQIDSRTLPVDTGSNVSDGPGLTMDGNDATIEVEEEPEEPENTEEPEETDDKAPSDDPVGTEMPEPSESPTVTVEPVRNGGPIAALGDYWVYILAGVGGIAILAIIGISIKKSGGEKVVGNLRITCDAIYLETLLVFDSHSNVKEDSPLTDHPEIAKLKRGKVYDVLSKVKVGMAQADSRGYVRGSEDQHLPDEKVISITYIDPRNNSKQVCYCGKNDIKDSVVSIYDAGRVYEVHFSGSLTVEEMINISYGRRK